MSAACGLELLNRVSIHAHAAPGALALRSRTGGSMTWAGLADAAAGVARALGPGPAIVLSCANSPAFVAAFLGGLLAGRYVFPLSIESADAETLRAARSAEADAVIGDERALRLLGRGSAVTLDAGSISSTGDPIAGAASFRDACKGACGGGLLLQTSGSSGNTRIVRRSAESLDAEARQVVESVGFGPADQVLMTLPLTHSYGLEHGLLAPLWARSAVTLCRGLAPADALEELASGRATILPGVPSTFEILAAAARPPDSAPGLRRAYSAGAPLPAGIGEAFADRLGTRVTQLYGASEIGSVTFQPPDDDAGAPNVGLPMPGVSIRILDSDDAPLPPEREGQVAVRAGSMFDDYLDGPAEWVDGYFPTGDLGRLDRAGRLYITGRLKLLIDVGGLKVNPQEVEAVLMRHPGVSACVVVASPQSATVNRLKAVLTLRDPGSTVPVEELKALARGHLASYKVPRFFEVREALPRSASGKVLRRLVETP